MTALLQNSSVAEAHYLVPPLLTPLLAPMIDSKDLISAQQVKQAKSLAVGQQRRVIEILEELTGYEQELFINVLSQSLHFTAISMKQLHALTVAFDVLPFQYAQQKECLAFYANENGLTQDLILVFADPFNESLQEWVIENIRQPFTWSLAHRHDIAAFLAKHEETMRAMDGLQEGANTSVSDSDEVVANLSLKSINEDTNPIIKLINSTLYDALKVGASDIHLECSTAGLSIKYRIDVGQYPSTEQGLAALNKSPANDAKWSGPYLKKSVPNDPWNKPYLYKSPGEHGDFDLYSFGKDGQQGGVKESEDVVSW